MNKLRFLILAVVISLLAPGCRPGGGSPVYDVVVVGGGPAGIGAALAAKQRRDPRDVSLDLVNKHLTGIGHIVP